MQKNCSNYPVEFAGDAFGAGNALAKLLKKVSGSDSPRVLIVADMNVVQRNEGLGSKIGKYVKDHGIRLADRPVVLAGGEKIKADGFAGFTKIATAMIAAKLGHEDLVLAIGGGSLLDVAGYAAAQVRGGCKLVRMPTTPAAMFGAAWADYAGLDSSSVKDAFRVASVPVAVVIDVTLANSVLDGVWRGGIGEAVRLAVAMDASLLKKIFKLQDAYCARDPKTLEELVKLVHAVYAKKGSTDFALWSSSRLEAMSNYKLPCGYSVPIGISVEMRYAAEKGDIKEKDRDTVFEFLMKSNALDGIKHSLHLVTQLDNLMFGIDAQRLQNGNEGITVLSGMGKTKLVEEPDRETYKKVLKELVALVTVQ